MTAPDWHWHDDELISYCFCGTASDLSPTEAQIVERFETAEAAPESYVRQHVSEADCWCEPYAVGTLGVMTHRMVGE